MHCTFLPVVRYAAWFFLCVAAATCGADEPARMFRNPILPGFYPDPSICRVGDDYYMVHSTFEYFPGVPVHHSKDLVNWRLIGHCLTRESQLPLKNMRASGGVFAPTLRYHDGTFYMVTTIVDGGGNLLVTATDPAGPWSEPVWLDASGIDPSLFFDDDGAVYYTRHEGMGDGYIAQRVLNIETGELEGELRNVWGGTGGVWAEGPHLYKINGTYYLMISEGGTSYDHMVTIARSDSPWGPFESYSGNPILTHRNRRDHAAQALGHADLVETPAGWWLVCLGIRPQGGTFHHIGRETFLAPVEWNEDGWPVVNGNGTVELELPAPDLPRHPFPAPPSWDGFDLDELALDWNFLRNPYEGDVSLTEQRGVLRLNGSAVTLNDKDSPAFVARRQTGLNCRAATQIGFFPVEDGEEAGLVVRGNDQNHYEIGVIRKDGERRVFFRKVLQGALVEPVRYEPAPNGHVVLAMNATSLEYEFYFQDPGGAGVKMGMSRTRDLSSETIGGFTGAYIGMYATGNGKKSTTPADFDWFEYSVRDE